MASKVWITDLRTKSGNNLLNKLERLMVKAGIDQIDFDKKMTAIKIHFGEPGNLAYLRPNFSATVAKYVRKKGAIPFLTDANTLYHGRRSNAPEHLEAAFENGYNPIATGCPVVIADGIKGTEYREIALNMECCKSAKIGSAIADADIIISMNHFKGHDMTGFGGALKNLGMGCASVGGKLFLHSVSSPRIHLDNCTGCRICEKFCSQEAIKVTNKKAVIDYNICIGCGQCVAVCQYDAAQVVWNNASELVCKRIAEYSYAVVKDKPAFHINFVLDISPNCDCWDFNDYPMVSNIGIAASFDPVAIDQACADLVKAAPALPASKICDEHPGNDLTGEDKFKHAAPNTDWEAGLEHGEKIGLGTRDYELIKI
jgi:uncharacterized Fe-S center protein